MIAARSASDCFEVAIEAVRIATTYMTPVMLLTDGYLQNAAEPWKVPDISTLEPFPKAFLEEAPEEGFKPFGRDEKGARPWVKPGTPGLLHRIGGIEKKQGTGNIDYSPANHQEMTDTRRAKVDGIAVPDQQVELGGTSGTLVVVGWGSTFGPIHQAVRRMRRRGYDVHVYDRHDRAGGLLRRRVRVLRLRAVMSEGRRRFSSPGVHPARSASRNAASV